MKRALILFFASFLFINFTFAQEEDEPTEKPVHKRMRGKLGGAGGFMPAWGLFKFDKLNAALTSAGMPTVSENSMTLFGGSGYGYVMFVRNIRMGGMGMSGSVKSSKLDPVTNFRKDVDYTISYGGFLIDYVIPVIDRLDFSVGVVIGGGNIDLAMRRDDGSFKDWNKIWNEYGRNDSTKNLTRRLNGDFFALTPNANLEYALLDWFQLRVGVAYPMFSSPDWKLDDQYEVISVPAGLKPDGPVIQAGIMFGFFN